MDKENLRALVRIGNADLDGRLKVYHGLTLIKGINFMFSNMVCKVSGIPKDKKVGALSDEEISSINDILKNPLKHDVPEWLLNRRKDYEDGEDKHLISGDIRFIQGNDIKMMQKIKSYKGSRHAARLPVRGQKTRSNFRKNKGRSSLGVQKKSKSGKK